jgi:hypothetical protein
MSLILHSKQCHTPASEMLRQCGIAHKAPGNVHFRYHHSSLIILAVLVKSVSKSLSKLGGRRSMTGQFVEAYPASHNAGT